MAAFSVFGHWAVKPSPCHGRVQQSEVLGYKQCAWMSRESVTGGGIQLHLCPGWPRRVLGAFLLCDRRPWAADGALDLFLRDVTSSPSGSEP